jgi:excisionase family DNA binding protein
MSSNLPTECLSMRPREAAKALGVSERTLWAWTHNGEIPHVRMGKAILYPVDALRRWLEARANKQEGQP